MGKIKQLISTALPHRGGKMKEENTILITTRFHPAQQILRMVRIRIGIFNN